jgi:hypothetical protein
MFVSCGQWPGTGTSDANRDRDSTLLSAGVVMTGTGPETRAHTVRQPGQGCKRVGEQPTRLLER